MVEAEAEAEAVPVLAAVASLAVLLAAEAALAGAAWAGWLELTHAALAHATLVAAFAVAARRCFAHDVTVLVVAVLATGAAGPLGAAAALGLSLTPAARQVRAPGLEAWYRRLSGGFQEDAAAALYDRIVDGRSFRPGRFTVEHFPTVLTGSLAEQQALLGLIGLDYHAEYRPLLQAALRSREASVRAQAAAVFAKLRARFRAEFLERTGPEAPEVAGLDAVRALMALASSGFLDVADQRTCRTRALDLCDAWLEANPGDTAAHGLRCRLLVESGRWAELLASGHEASADPAIRADYARGLMLMGRARDLSIAFADRPLTLEGSAHVP